MASYTKDLYEICQFNNLTLDYSIKVISMRTIGGQSFPKRECVLTILNKDTEITKIKLIAYGSKKEIKHNTSKALLESDYGKTKLQPYITTKQRGKIYEPIEDNKYILWGKSLLTKYNLYLNDISCLDLFKTTDIAVDSEGFPQNGTTASLIQIADNENVAIFDYCRYNKEINAFLKTKRLILCDAESDLRMLNIIPRDYVDIQKEYKNNPDDKPKSLKTMAGEMVNQSFKKPDGMFYVYEKWKIENLDIYHKIYAATDAIATFKLFKNLTNIGSDLH